METGFERRYARIERLGGGQSGEVWKAHDNYFNIDVALKLIADPRYVADAIPEAARLKALEGERILRVLDVDVVETGDFAFVATELALGSTEDELDRLGCVGVRADRVVTWVRQGLTGLAACHAHGFIHRDVKPANVFLRGPEWAQLGDFGASAPIDADGKVRSGGDPQVRPPEMLKGGRVDIRGDVYSVGVTMYRLLTGEWPVVEADFADLRRRVADADYPDVRLLGPHVPLSLALIVRKAMSVRPDDRYANADEMQEALARVRLTSAWQPEPRTSTELAWRQVGPVNGTTHHVRVRSNGTRFDIETKRATGAMTRVTALCYSSVPRANFAARLHHVFKTLDDRI
jgi:eukaryotic-like serine/threonine-protein kinase